MKLMTLNIWGGHVRLPLFEFITAHREADIFCFQEVYHNALDKVSDDDRAVSLNIFSELEALLPDHRSFFRPLVNNTYGIGMFVKKSIDVLDEGEIPIYENPHYRGMGPAHSRNLQWIQCSNYSIINVHGLWNGKGKTDAPERIAQSQKMRHFLDSLQTPTILCGDLNLRPDTESIRILERGMKNLVRDFNVKSTRTSLYPSEEKFADYILISPKIKVNQFEVLTDEVSDHCPLLLDFAL